MSERPKQIFKMAMAIGNDANADPIENWCAPDKNDRHAERYVKNSCCQCAAEQKCGVGQANSCRSAKEEIKEGLMQFKMISSVSFLLQSRLNLGFKMKNLGFKMKMKLKIACNFSKQ